MERALKTLLCCSLGLCVLLYFFWSRHWPLVGDASLIHYICFLMDHGMAPYRDLGDMNMPGAYIVEWTVMHTLGGGEAAWRIFDFVLMVVAAIANFAITLPVWTGLLDSCRSTLHPRAWQGRPGAGRATRPDDGDLPSGVDCVSL